MYKVSFIHRVTKVLVDLMFYGGIVMVAVFPFIMPWLEEWYAFSIAWTRPSVAVIMAAGVCALYILYQLKRMFKTLIGKEPFVHQNVSCFRKCGVASFLISLLFVVRAFIWFTFGSAIIVVIFAMLGLFSLTMKDVFKQAVFYKEENDWTV